MSTAWLDDYETEDYDTEAEDYGDLDSESTAAERRRQRWERDRQMLRARREFQDNQVRRRRAAARRAPQDASIRDLGLKTTVETDVLRRQILELRRSARFASYSTVGFVAMDQAIDTFGLEDQPAPIRAILRAAPLMLLAPQRRGDGVGSLLSDPRVAGALIVGGIMLAGVAKDRLSEDAVTSAQSSGNPGGGGGGGSNGSPGGPQGSGEASKAENAAKPMSDAGGR